MAKIKPVSYYVTFELLAQPDEVSVKEIKAEIKMLLTGYCAYRTKDLLVEPVDA